MNGDRSEIGLVSRRSVLKVMGAGLALAGFSGCVQEPEEKIVPYVLPPEHLLPGMPIYFATATRFSGLANPVLVENHMGRPTKIEGNPEHPESLGATDAFTQAQVLSLYDPDRSQVVTHKGRIRTWTSYLSEIGPVMTAQEG